MSSSSACLSAVFALTSRDRARLVAALKYSHPHTSRAPDTELLTGSLVKSHNQLRGLLSADGEADAWDLPKLHSYKVAESDENSGLSLSPEHGPSQLLTAV